MIRMIVGDISLMAQSDLFWAALVVALALASALLAAAIVTYLQKQGLQQRVGVEISNRGNVACRYEARAESALPDLNFAFTLDGKQLARQEYSEKQTFTAPARPQPAAPVNGNNGAGVGAGIGDAAQRGVATLGAVARLMALVAAVLPGAAARTAVSRTAMTVYNAEWTSRRVMQVPQQVAQVGHTAMGAGGASYTGASYGSGANPASEMQVQIVRQSWAQTPELQPGETVCLNLLISPQRVFGGGVRTFTVLSRPTGPANAAVVAEQGSVVLGSASRWRRYAPYALIAFTTIAILAFVLWAMLA